MNQETKMVKPKWDDLSDNDKRKYIDKVLYLLESGFIPKSPFEAPNVELIAKSIYNGK